MDLFGHDINPYIGSTIFGLPDWWFLISAGFFLVLILFLVIAYFKGRTIIREKKERTGISLIRCSVCGKMMRDYIEECPGCGARFTNDRYICPVCGEEVDPDADSCSGCHKVLQKMDKPNLSKMDGNVRKDPDLMRLKEKKRKRSFHCQKCGKKIDIHSSECPYCGNIT